LVAGLFVWFFADALFGGGVFVFRDAGHYYYPLFQFIKSEWGAGRVPLWNPYENLGVPLAGNPTSSVFYPGTLIFLLPFDYAWSYKLYVMGHVLLAAGAAYRLGRHWQGSVEASAAGAISYAFCGNVLFQYSNVVFLVGAAWLPLAVLAADRMLGEGRRVSGKGRAEGDEGQRVKGKGQGVRVRSALLLGVVLALMALGGNAEMAYHAGLIAAMYAAWLWWCEPKGRRRGPLSVSGDQQRRPLSLSGVQRRCPLSLWERVGVRAWGWLSLLFGSSACSKPPHPDPLREGEGKLRGQALMIRLARCRPALLTLAAATGLILSAVQVFPAVELSRRSGRVATTVPRTVYEVPKCVLSTRPQSHAEDVSWIDGLACRRLDAGSHHQHVYHFSVGPWRLAEYLWPNFGGRQFPVHRRWLEVVPGEGRIWAPSLYMGLLPLVFALAAIRLGRRDPRQSWLSWLVLLSVVASFGWFSLGWLVHRIRAAAGGDVSGPWAVGAPFGGLYWLMTVLLPGYIYFRYPAKLLVIAALGLSMLAVRGWDRAFDGPSSRVRHGLLWLGGVSLLGAIVALAVFPFRHAWLGNVEPDVLFGPLDEAAACRDLLFAFLQTAVLCGAGWWLLRRAAGGARWAQTAALVLVAVDLAVANGWMVACAPADEWHKRPKLAVVLREDRARRGDAEPYRVYRRPIWMPPSWRSSASPTRLVEAMRWDRDTLWPKYNLAEAIPVAEVQSTMNPYDYQVFLWVANKRGHGTVSSRETAGPYFVAKYLVLRGGDPMRGMEPIELDGTAAEGLEDVSLWYNPNCLPRAWIVHDVDVLPPLSSDDPREVWRRTEQVLYPHGRARNLRQSAAVEADLKLDGVEGEVGHEQCRIVRYDPSCVEIEAELKRPGLVVLCDQFYPGWRLAVDTLGQKTREVPILRANRVMRGAWLDAGSHRLVYRYHPASFLWGAWLSGIGGIGLAAIAAAMRLSEEVKGSGVFNRVGSQSSTNQA